MPRKIKILIVDDEQDIREFLAQILSQNYQVIFAKNGEEAVEIAKVQLPSIILLDIIMPIKTGIEACKELRACPKTINIPILFLSALNSSDKRTDAFLAGADDYINKPFVPDELLARIESKLRRSAERNTQEKDSVEYGDLIVNYQQLKVIHDTKDLELGQTEFKILSCLIKRKGELVTRDELNNFIWQDEIPSDRALDPHITTLRKKLKDSLCELKTVYGQGYGLVLKHTTHI